MVQGTQIDKSKKTVGVIVAVVFALIILKCGCNRVGFADGAEQVSLSPTTFFNEPVGKAMERGAGRTRPFIVRCLEAQTITKTMRVTAYCPCKKCCGRWADGITASGHAINPGDLLCAAGPNIPFGTRIEIPGYSKLPVRVLDRGGDIKGNRIDVLFYDGNLETSHQKALAWGVQYLECKIYDGS